MPAKRRIGQVAGGREGRLQAGIIQWLIAQRFAGRDFLYAASLEGVKLTKGQALKAKQQGMVSGEPDLRIYLPGGRLEMFELKYGDTNTSEAQDDRHLDLHNLGFYVHVISALTVNEACAKIQEKLGGPSWGGLHL